MGTGLSPAGGKAPRSPAASVVCNPSPASAGIHRGFEKGRRSTRTFSPACGDTPPFGRSKRRSSFLLPRSRGYSVRPYVRWMRAELGRKMADASPHADLGAWSEWLTCLGEY